MLHKPVLLEEVLRGLNLKRGMTVADGTLGSAGHSAEILKLIGPEGRLVGLDQDPAALERSRNRLKEYAAQVFLHHSNFEKLDEVLDLLSIKEVDAVIIDIGFSSDQLEDAERGFSFERQGPLDMRMNPDLEVTAQDLVNKLSEKELADTFWIYGEERFSRRFAKSIVQRRAAKPLETTFDLVEAVEAGLPFRPRRGPSGRPVGLHPATRVFQALRIAVNSELDVLKNGLPRIWSRVKKGGRFGVIAFHSLEDRIVKHQFQAWVKAGEAVAVTKKPIVASEEEIHSNPRSRSAKLRIVEKP